MLIERNPTKSISISNVDSNPFASRLTKLGAESLSASLQMFGQLSPIMVRPSSVSPERFQVVFGHRRLESAKALGWKTISAYLSDVSDEQMITLSLAENAERNGFTDYEQGILFRKMNEAFGRSITEISQSVGRSVAFISQHIAMTRLFEGDDNIDKRGAVALLQQLTERQSRVLSRLQYPIERLHYAKLCISENLCLREMDRLVGHPRKLFTAEELEETKLARRSTKEEDEEQIYNIIQQTLEATNKKDSRPMQSYRSQDFSLFDDFLPYELLDHEKAERFNVFMIKSIDSQNLKCDDVRIHSFGRFAFATFVVSYKLCHDLKWFPVMSKVTAVFVKRETRWLVLHEHWSPLRYEYVEDIERIRRKIVIPHI